MAPDAAAALTSLLKSSTIHDHEEALKVATAALAADKSDVRSQRARVVALLKLDRFHDAVRAVSEGGTKAEEACALELAYALYKTGKLDQAAALLSRDKSRTTRASEHLAAQVAYRAERFQDALDKYRRLVRESARDGLSGEDNDLLVNSLAVTAQLGWQRRGNGQEVEDPLSQGNDGDSFEVVYNTACNSIARGDIAEASGLLKRALHLCDASDDLSEEEKAIERLPLLIQQAYVFARLGRDGDALALYDSIPLSREEETESTARAKTNLCVLEAAGENPYLTQRKMQSTADASEEGAVFHYQKALQRQNRYAVDLLASKFPGVEARAARAVCGKEGPVTSAELNNTSIAGAAARCQNGIGKRAKRDTLALYGERPYDIGLLLTTMQLYLNNGNISAASSLLEAFFQRRKATPGSADADVRHAPGLVALAATLYRAQGRGASLRAELVAAAAHWQSRGADGSGALALLREAGVELMKSSRPEERAAAGAAFAAVYENQRRDAVTEAGIVACFAATDPKKAAPCLATLPPVDSLIPGVDTDALMEAGVALGPQNQHSVRKRVAESEGAGRPAVKKRKRKLPEDYEEGKVMDPERWLPLRDRSSYRPKGKKGKKRAQESTQGGVVKEEETLELVGGAGAVKVEKAPTASSSSSKRKKKGKR